MKYTNLLNYKHFIYKRLTLVLSLLIVLTFNLKFNFSYTPVTEGWFIVYGMAINDGLKLYNDVPLHLTPLYPYINSLFSSLFGYGIFEFRLLGVIVIMLMTLLLYKIISLYYSRLISSCLSVFGIIYYQSGNAHITYDFTQFYSLFALISIYATLKCTFDVDSYKTRYIYTIMIGVFSAASFLIKQSNGAYIFAACMIAPHFIKQLSLRNIFVIYVAAALTLFGVLFDILIGGDFVRFYNQIYVDALAVKGGSTMILFNWMRGLFGPILKSQSLIILTVVLTSFAFSHIYLLLASNRIITFRLLKISSLFGAFCVVYVLLVILQYIEPSEFVLINGAKIYNLLIPINILFIAFLYIDFVSRRYFGRNLTKINAPQILAFMLLSLLAGNGTSAGLSEISAFLGSSLAVATIASNIKLGFLKQTLVAIFITIVVVYLVNLKYTRPYEWWGVKSKPVTEATKLVDIGPFKGLYTDLSSYEFLLEAQKFFIGEKKVYGFPNTVLPYLINHTYTTGSVVQWFDFMTDYEAFTECARIRTDMPSKLLYVKVPSLAWTKHEELFRNNRELGQRCFLELFENERYRINYTFINETTHIELLDRK